MHEPRIHERLSGPATRAQDQLLQWSEGALRRQAPDAVSRRGPLDTSEKRAGKLADTIDQKFPAGAIHIIAHSMAGLDSRSLIGRNLHGLSAPGRIASLTTLSTPHLGSPVADL